VSNDITVVQTDRGLAGMGDQSERDYSRFQSFVRNLGVGEFFLFRYWRPRNPKFHRKFFALLNYAFDHWEPAEGRRRLKHHGVPIEKNFEIFRKHITILAGYYTATYDLRGRLHLEAKSIAFDKMDDTEFEQLYAKVVDVLIKHVLTNYKHEDVDRVVENLERFA
jgi:hypothetical protein